MPVEIASVMAEPGGCPGSPLARGTRGDATRSAHSRAGVNPVRTCEPPGPSMDFSFSEQQESIRAGIAKICARFGDDYWLRKDRDGGFPHDFHAAFAEAGWLGICIPEEFGGAGLGLTEASLMMQAVAESGAGL